MNRRGLLLAAALVATLALAVWPPGEAGVRAAGPVTQARATSAVGATAAPAEASAKPAASEPRFPKLGGNLFPSQTWRPPPPPPPKVKPVPPPPPPPPEPPPFPFAYFGRWAEPDKEVVFLKRGEQLMRVKAGDVINGAWRLDRVDRGGLVFTYLPLNMQKTMRIER